jgi:hypothetical protein
MLIFHHSGAAVNSPALADTMANCPPTLSHEQLVPSILRVGVPTVVESCAESSSFGAVFEDDGETGYFYGLDTRLDESIVDALHVYNVETVQDRDRPSEVEIVWSGDGLSAALLINGYAHAAFDFGARRGYCRTGFPETSRWSAQGHGWDDAAIAFIERAT